MTDKLTQYNATISQGITNVNSNPVFTPTQVTTATAGLTNLSTLANNNVSMHSNLLPSVMNNSSILHSLNLGADIPSSISSCAIFNNYIGYLNSATDLVGLSTLVGSIVGANPTQILTILTTIESLYALSQQNFNSAELISSSLQSVTNIIMATASIMKNPCLLASTIGDSSSIIASISPIISSEALSYANISSIPTNYLSNVTAFNMSSLQGL